MDKSVKFKDFDCIAKLSKYSDTNQPSLRLIDKEDGLPVANASLNLSNYPLSEGCIFIKDYSENSGMLSALQAANIIGKVEAEYPLSQFVNVQMCKLLIEEE
tara:strand:- start:1054 stop:1359 length:306 start_codon:yes stop_codon:yes gene_type:complete